jgi:histidinol-phosphate/aromatic aminotransferase/cobyric acid decarboxylase-like protein
VRDAPGLDVAALEDAAGLADLVVVVNPNNPRGTTLPSAEVHALAARHPGTRFLVDESFIEFSGQPPLVRLLEETPLANVIVLVSLSKTLGIPGLRLGYVHSTDAALLAGVSARLPVWNLGALAEHFL